MLKDISEKVSYLQGLSEGLNIREGSPQGKIITGILSVLDEMADKLINMQEGFVNLKEYVESIDDDLTEIEENWLDGDRDFVETRCSKCGEQLYFESDILDDEDTIEIICPNCNEVVFVNDGSFDYEPSFIEDEMDNSSHSKQNPSPS